ncbi:aldehyde dehydrogenase family protein [Ornithinimicrobium cerasi]|uniref:aldehyde dehydrogenase family protein n=1 Tax=Ornithinimicrobium cerasi TaxID=2248773 RepID=UPI00192A386A|nr:aldehyde dehydrogenase family protein [Ornithinimicrobium cerasi]
MTAGYGETVALLRHPVTAGVTRDLTWRRAQLRALRALVVEHEDELTRAVVADVGKPALEVRLTELSFVVQEIDTLLANLARWTAPRRVPLPATHLPGSAAVHLVPKGVVLIIGPWNYPVQLVLAPLAGALAAGNTVVVKPSEHAPTVAALLAELVGRHLPADAVQVVTGGVPETTALLRERWDHIFFTGSSAVGRVVMRAAAEHLTPVTLELGGKSPTFVDGTVDPDLAARRIAWGKFTNAGQSCVAPDYVMVTPDAREGLVAALDAAIGDFFGDDPSASADLGRIVNDHHHARLVELVGASGGVVTTGGGHDVDDGHYLAPTVLTGVAHDSPVMAEEIFGPVLPVVEVADARAAVDLVNARPRPLALYVFSDDAATRRLFEERTTSGGLAHGVPLIHLAVPGLPFGGVGESGMGRYLGRASIDELSHHRSVLSKPLRPDTLAAIYPPHPTWKASMIRGVMAPLGRGLRASEVPALVARSIRGVSSRLRGVG